MSHQPEHTTVLTKLPERHDYNRCAFSGAGNCCCGRGVESVLHPHSFTPMRVDPMRCVCLKAAELERSLCCPGGPMTANEDGRPLRVYVSAPYTLDPVRCTAEAIAAGSAILDAGHAPFVPHLSHYWHTLHGERHYEDWMRIDLEWLRGADVVVRLPGPSGGADREVDLARSLGIPVFEKSINDALAELDSFRAIGIRSTVDSWLGLGSETRERVGYVTLATLLASKQPPNSDDLALEITDAVLAELRSRASIGPDSERIRELEAENKRLRHLAQWVADTYTDEGRDDWWKAWDNADPQKRQRMYVGLASAQ